MNKICKTLLICGALTAGCIAAYCGDNYYREYKENELEQGQIEATDSGIQIRTKYYNLNCPSSWSNVSIAVKPTNEKYTGDPMYRRFEEPYIDPDAYTLRLYYDDDKGKSKIADLALYAHLEDAQSIPNWISAGEITVFGDTWYKSNLLVIYPSYTQPAEDSAGYIQVLQSLPDVVTHMEPRREFLLREDQSQNKHVGWYADWDTEEHGETWEEYYDGLYQSYLREQEKKEKQKKKEIMDATIGPGGKSSLPSSSSGSSKRKSSYYSDPYDVNDYDDPDDFADEWVDEFNEDGDEDDAWEEAYDYWEDHHK